MSAAGHMLEYKGKPVALFGMGNFWALHDLRVDYEDMLSAYSSDGSNFLRMSLFGHTVRNLIDDETERQYPFVRTGPGNWGPTPPQLKFDCTVFDQNYFDRLEAIQSYADSIGTVCLWVLWDEIPLESGDRRWHYSSWNPDNNINGFGLPSVDAVPEFYDLGNTSLLSAQEAYVTKMLDTIGHYDNLIISHSNEYTGAEPWAQHWQDFIDAWETANNGSVLTLDLEFSGWTPDFFDMISLTTAQEGPATNWRTSPTIKPVVNHKTGPKFEVPSERDSARRAWWRVFCNGGHTGDDSHDGPDPPDQHTSSNTLIARGQISHMRTMLSKLPFNEMVPSFDFRAGMVSTGVMRVKPGWHYLIYMDGALSVNVDLQDAVGTFQVEWLDTVNGTLTAGSPPTVNGGSSSQSITGAPFSDSVLWIHK